MLKFGNSEIENQIQRTFFRTIVRSKIIGEAEDHTVLHYKKERLPWEECERLSQTVLYGWDTNVSLSSDRKILLDEGNN